MSTTRLTWTNEAATVVVAALIFVYAELLARGSVGFIVDPRSMGSIGLISAVFLCPLGGGARASGAWVPVMSLAGIVTLALGIATVVTVSWGVLAAFMIAIFAMWALTTVHHALGTAPKSSSRVGAAHA
jgi:hypothetical protein